MKAIIKFIGAAIAVIVLVGCQHYATHPSAALRYRIFEASVEDANKVIPVVERSKSDSSEYALARVHRDEITLLLTRMAVKPGLLIDHRRVVGWPRTVDTWTYSHADGTLLVAGGGTGFLGARAKHGIHEVSIEYDVTHILDAEEPIQTKITYKGSIADGDGLLFLKPFVRKDGTNLVHAIAFEVTDWK